MGALEEAAARALRRPGAAAQFRLDAAAVAGGLRPAALLDYVPLGANEAAGAPRRGNRGKEVRDWGVKAAEGERARAVALALAARAAAAAVGRDRGTSLLLVAVFRGSVLLFSAEHSARLLQAQRSLFARLEPGDGCVARWAALDGAEHLPGPCRAALELLLRAADGGRAARGGDDDGGVLDLDSLCSGEGRQGRGAGGELAPATLVGWLLGYPVVYCFQAGSEREVAEALGGAPLTRVAVHAEFPPPLRRLGAGSPGRAPEIIAFTYPGSLPGASAAVAAFLERVRGLSGRVPGLGALECSCSAVDANSCVIAI